MSRRDIYIHTKRKCTVKRVQVKLCTADDEVRSYCMDQDRKKAQLTTYPVVCIAEGMAKTISIRIDEELLHAVDVAGEVEQRGRSEMIREALEEWLKHRRLAEKVRRHREGYARHPVAPEEFAPVLGAQTWPK